jgi:hypothetical protein
MTQIYAGNVRSISTYESPGVSEWADMYHLLANNVVMIDRSEKIILPFNVKLFERFKLPSLDNAFTMTYDQCCERRATELYELAKQLNKPLYLFYSGGIDSTLMLISFLKVIPENDREVLVLMMDYDSIKENPNMYYTNIRGKIKTISSSSFSKYFDKSCILVGGEFNDQLFGSDIVKLVHQRYGIDTIHQRYTRDNITTLFKDVGMSSIGADIWYDLIDESCKNSPVVLITVFDFLWWLNFNFKWQAVFFRLLIRCGKEQRNNIDQQFVDTYYHHFYGEEYFQQWSMINQDLKIKESWQSYKFIAKQLIYDYTQDSDYFYNKEKLPSLGRMFMQKKTSHGLTTDFIFLDTLDAESLYVPDNSFIQQPLNKR